LQSFPSLTFNSETFKATGGTEPPHETRQRIQRMRVRSEAQEEQKQKGKQVLDRLPFL
jgi:hypothetical protein